MRTVVLTLTNEILVLIQNEATVWGPGWTPVAVFQDRLCN